MKFESVFVTGGAGYCGSYLVPQLLSKGYKVTVYDIMYFGNEFLPKENPNLTLIEGDIRNTAKIQEFCRNHDVFVSLACISNDASFELDENLSTSVNLDAFEPMVLAAKTSGIKRFIYASSSSVYGVSDEPNVTEDHPLVPLTLYNKYKGVCESLLQKHTTNDFVGVTFRPATVCGYAPRQRLDLSVNILTNHAVNKNHITVFGGDQLRPNLHIKDYCEVVDILLNAPDEKIQNEVFNAGFQNMSIKDIAILAKRVVEEEFPDKSDIKITTTSSDDNRSYHINSDKIKRILGFVPKYSVEFAIRELCGAFREGKLPNSFDNDDYFNVRRLKRIQAI
ncbi:SDR family oxidoreductase [Daejeonella sp.]|uniref:NAD-dependent epimerase/dehydratase family protein n=1 Tax=Daejeonella sp. TaxID=2805397 RepID=UPI0030C332FD